MKNRTTAGLLALLLGGIGGHKFYLDRPGQGLLYLLFCWTFIPAFIAFIEAIMYFSMSDASFDATYNAGVLAARPAAPMIVQVTNTATANGRSVASELKDLKALWESGDLTEAQFQAQKAKLLSA
jgi:TM2 domain-containing membrane protein YozV